MPATMIGVVYYDDDPDKKVFRKVYPTQDNSELDDPAHCTVGVDATRTAVLLKVPANDDSKYPMTGTP